LSNTLNEKNVTKWLAQFVANSQWKDIPLSVRHEAKRAILNIFGCILGGCRDDVTGRALSVLDTFSGVREATVMGRSKKLDVLSAAYGRATLGSNQFSCSAMDRKFASLRLPST
jgi:2-methylcitrate dehydratase PrpD